MVSNTELSEFRGSHRAPGRELSEFISACSLWVKRNSSSFFAELSEFAAELSEFPLPKQYSRNSIPPVSKRGTRCKIGVLIEAYAFVSMCQKGPTARGPQKRCPRSVFDKYPTNFWLNPHSLFCGKEIMWDNFRQLRKRSLPLVIVTSQPLISRRHKHLLLIAPTSLRSHILQIDFPFNFGAALHDATFELKLAQRLSRGESGTSPPLPKKKLREAGLRRKPSVVSHQFRSRSENWVFAWLWLWVQFRKLLPGYSRIPRVAPRAPFFLEGGSDQRPSDMFTCSWWLTMQRCWRGKEVDITMASLAPPWRCSTAVRRLGLNASRWSNH